MTINEQTVTQYVEQNIRNGEFIWPPYAAYPSDINYHIREEARRRAIAEFLHENPHIVQKAETEAKLIEGLAQLHPQQSNNSRGEKGTIGHRGSTADLSDEQGNPVFSESMLHQQIDYLESESSKSPTFTKEAPLDRLKALCTRMYLFFQPAGRGHELVIDAIMKEPLFTNDLVDSLGNKVNPFAMRHATYIDAAVFSQKDVDRMCLSMIHSFYNTRVYFKDPTLPKQK